MKIGFDLDKVLVDYPPLVPDIVIDKLYKKKANGSLIYRFPNTLEQRIRKISHHPLLRPGIKNNLTFLKSIPKTKHKLYLVSSRFGFLEMETARIMKNLGLNDVFDEIYFNFKNEQPHEFKEKIITKLKLDLYVDDDFPLIKYVAKRNKKTQFFWLTRKRKHEKLTRNIIAIDQISDIFSR